MSKEALGVRIYYPTWTWKVGRIAFTHRFKTRRIQLVQAGCLYEIWIPIAFGLYWRKKQYLKYVNRWQR